MVTPIQVVIDSKSYVTDFTKPVGGDGKKDFYKGRNEDFRKHRDRLVKQVRSLAQSSNMFQRSSVVVASVELVPDALAKSNRPSVLLTDRNVRSVGTGRPAELLIQVSARSLAELANKIEKAPVELEKKDKVDKSTGEVVQVDRVTSLRSDVGAIDSVSFWDASRKLTLSFEAMRRWYSQPGTPLSLVVRLFQFDDQTNATELSRLRQSLSSLGMTYTQDSGQGESMEAMVLLVSLPRNEVEARWDDALPALIETLTESAIVRSIHAPARISRAVGVQPPSLVSGGKATIPLPAGGSHPVVGIVDGGVAGHFEDWVVYREQYIAIRDAELSHGTEIAGLLVMGRSLNSEAICAEPDGCQIVDLCLVPDDKSNKGLFRSYYGDTATLFEKLDEEVGNAKALTGVRVFNFSLNLQIPIDAQDDYCYETQRLDRIAWKHDVIFVVSAGNLSGGGWRPEWPQDPVGALATFALGVRDRITSPAESISNISVAALNTPGITGSQASALAAYSRRGPSPFGGLKPDVAHFGGCGIAAGPTGLLTVNQQGGTKAVHGTSYAAPLVAKVLARYRHLLEGDVSREALIALLVHNSKVPPPFAVSPISEISKDLIGFGMPLPVEEALDGNDHSATLVFEAHIPKGKRLEFPFPWPAALTQADGKCRGKGRLTLVSRPKISVSEGAELVRTQLDAHVLQLDQAGKAKGGSFKTVGVPAVVRQSEKQKEVVQRRHQLKWSPIKVYEFEARKGVGLTSNWRLTVESLERLPGETPDEGIHFVAILTIEDADKKAPVFAEMKQGLTRMGIKLQDLRLAVRARAQ